MAEVIVAGHICLDIIPRFDVATLSNMDDVLVPGRVTEIGPAVLSTGGAVSNTGLNLHKLGIDTALMGKIGDDLFGRAIVDIIKRYGPKLADGMTIVPGAVTSYTLVIDPPGTDRAFVHCVGANHTFGADDVRYGLLEDARLLHFGYPTIMARMRANDGAELVELFRRAKATGISTSLDVAMPDTNRPSGQVHWRTLLENTLPHVDIFAPSFEELLFMLERRRFEALDSEGDILAGMTTADVQNLADQVLAMGAKMLLLKVGERGAYLRTAKHLSRDKLGRGAPRDLDVWTGRELWAPCFIPEVFVGTTGTGDATIAGFLAAVLRGQSPHEALITATAVGACSVEGANALDGVLTLEETIARVRAGWRTQPIEVSDAGWQRDKEHKLLLGPHNSPSSDAPVMGTKSINTETDS